MNSRIRVGFLAIAVIGGVALAIVVNFATGASLSQWSDTASITAAAAAVIGLLVSVSVAFFAERSINAEDRAESDREQLGFRLIRTFVAIEKEVSLRYQQQSSEASSHPLSLRQIKAIMDNSGVWDHQDQISFDLATRARNAIVHGDLDEVDSFDLLSANKKAEQLLKKTQEAETTGRLTE